MLYIICLVLIIIVNIYFQYFQLRFHSETLHRFNALVVIASMVRRTKHNEKKVNDFGPVSSYACIRTPVF